MMDGALAFVKAAVSGSVGALVGSGDAPERLVVSKAVAQAALTLDDGYRRARRWPLVGEAGLAAMQAVHVQPVAPDAGKPAKVQRRPIPDVAPASEMVVTASHYRSGMSLQAHPVTSAAVREELLRWFPALETIFAIAGDRIVVAGGSVVWAAIMASQESSDRNARRSRPPYGSDCDLFFVGVQPSEVRKLLDDVCGAAFPAGTALFTRNDNAITIGLSGPHHSSHPYQFILRLYDRVDQVLGGFDIGLCGIAYSPSLGLVATPLAALSLTTSCVFVDCSRRSLSYEHRLFKYMHRGFRLIFSSLRDPDTAPDAIMLGDQPCLRRQALNAGVTWTMWAVGTKEHGGNENSDYGADEHPCVHAYSNIIKAAQCKPGAKFSAATVVGSSLEELLDRPTVPGGVGLEALFQRRARNAYHRGDNVLDKYMRWFGPDAQDFILAKMAKNNEARDAVVARTVKRVSEMLLQAARDVKPLQLLTVDPGRQYTGSFNPISEPPQHWYRECYSPTRIGLPSLEMVWLFKRLFKQYAFPRDLCNWIVQTHIIPAVAKGILASSGFLYLEM